MKYLVYLTLTISLSLTASAANKLGSQCGLIDTNETEEWKEIGKTISLGRATPAQINKLPTLTKQQLIVAAKYFAKGDTEAPKITNTVEAVEYLKSSDGVNVSQIKVKNRRVTEVMTYPGDNPYSVIFNAGSLRIVAFGEDGTVVCN